MEDVLKKMELRRLLNAIHTESLDDEKEKKVALRIKELKTELSAFSGRELDYMEV